MKNYLSLFAFLGLILNINAQEPLDIRFQPDSSLYLYKVNSSPVEVYTAVLQNLAIVNISSDSLRIDKITMTVIKDSLIVQKIFIDNKKLNTSAQRINSFQEKDKLDLLEYKLQRSLYLKGVKFSPTTKLKKNHSIIISATPFLFNVLPDEIIVTAHFFNNEGKEATLSNEIKLMEYKSPNQYDFPLKGSWSAFGAPTLNSHHRWVSIQEFAYDFVKMDKTGNTHKKKGDKFKHYYAYGEPIYSIGNGKVVSILNTVKESSLLLNNDIESQDERMNKIKNLQNELLKKGFEYILGNHVIIEHPNGEYSYYMHLKTGSINVQVGDSISKGQEIGKLGQSGMSSQPHLHFQLSNSPKIIESRCLPIVFNNIGDNEWNILYGDIIKTEK
jgi:hypothetical protein